MTGRRYVDAAGRRRTLSEAQEVYLRAADEHPFDYGYGGLRSTQTVRILEERGLVAVRSFGEPADWRVLGTTERGRAVLAELAAG